MQELERGDLADILAEFISETRESLEQFELTLLQLESDPTAADLIAALFRIVHSIKGSCGFLALAKLEAITHAGETLLSLARDGDLAVDGEAADALLAMVDIVRGVVANLASSGTEGELDAEPIVARLEQIATYDAGPRVAGAADPSPDQANAGDLAHRISEGKIRVDVGLIDRLMNLVGELVLARNQIVQLAAGESATTLAAPSQKLSLVTTELQEAVMKTRMQPIGNVWSRLPRLVRDLAQSTGKRVRLQLVGRETELDKTIIEAIQDPLTHLVRNAIDHGIEPPERRRAAGKADESVLQLRAFHEGGMVNIEIIDDGAGLDPNALKRRAVELGLINADQAAQLHDREATSLVFLPGLSTAESVTSISGRGVGMDVVRGNVEKIGGTVDVQSRPGRGTSIRIKIPLTLAIIPALIVKSAGQSYAIAQSNLVEVVRLEEREGDQAIERVQDAPVVRLRGRLLPVAYLSRELGGAPAIAIDAAVSIVVLLADERTFGLVVDDVGDTEEIVVKPLWKPLTGLGCYAGATVMGDGRVALILDAVGLSRRLGITGGDRAREVETTVAQPRPEEARESELAVLCGTARDGRLAIALSQVARLEELPVASVEHVGDQEVVQYRGQLLPLVRLSSLLGEVAEGPDGGGPSAVEEETLQVVVYSRDERSIGLVVDRVLDIAELPSRLQSPAARQGVRGSVTVQGRITEVLDVESIIHKADPTFFGKREGVVP